MQDRTPWGSAAYDGEGRALGDVLPPGGSQHQRDEHRSRGSLGQFIERSTSAPPPTSEFPFGHGRTSLGGTNLLDQVTQGYENMKITSHSANPSADDSGGDRDYFRSGSSLSMNESRNQSASSYLQSGFDVSPQSRNNSGDLPALSPVGTRLASGLVRSQSAAPAYNAAAPPGLPGGGIANDPIRISPRPGSNVRRPASTGIINSEDDLLRPSTRTLMDLIGEDDTALAETQRHHHTARSPRVSVANRGHSYASPLSSQYEQDLGWLDGQTLTRGDPQASNAHFPQSRPGEDLAGVRFDSYHQEQESVQVPGRTGLSLQQSIPAPQYQVARNTNLPGHPIVHQSQVDYQQHSQQQQPQVYYSKQPQQVEHPRHLQAQLLPNGQTVYVNTSSAAQLPHSSLQLQPQQQQQSVIYQGQQAVLQPQQQVIQRDASGRQYVSVLPVQSGAQQLAYWPQEGAQGLTGLPPMHSGGNTSSSIRQNQSHDHQPQYGRRERGRGGGGGGGGGSGGGGGRRGPRRGNDSRSSHSSSSPLLEEFRSSKSRDWTVFQIEGHVVEFCQDQNGSRFIQQRLEMGDVTEQQVVMREVLPAIRRLRNDVFGNYVVQKLLDFGTPAMKADIRDTLEGEMLQLSLQMYGCRVVQKALESLTEEDLPRLLAEFHHNVLSCIHDQNGNHVIQKCVEVISHRSKKAEAAGDIERAETLTEYASFIVNDVLVNASALSCHPYGCRVLQRILEHCEKNKKSEVLDEISKSHRKLLDDQYGNYVIQHVLQFGRPSDRDSLLAIIVENGLLVLSRQKFASNVVEKLLKYGNGTQRRAIVREMLKKNMDSSPMNGPAGVNSVVLLMVRDAYANYVVQTTLDVVPESEEKRLLLEELNAHSEELRNYTFAKHIVTKLAALNSS